MRVATISILLCVSLAARAQFITPELVLFAPEGTRLSTYDAVATRYTDSVIIGLPVVASIRIDETNRVGYLVGTDPVTDMGSIIRFNGRDLINTRIVPTDTTYLGLGVHPTDIAFLDSSTAIVSFAEPAGVRRFDLNNRTLGPLQEFAGLAAARRMLRTANNRVVIVGGTKSGALVIYDWKENTTVATIDVPDAVSQVELAADFRVHALAPGMFSSSVIVVNDSGTVDTMIRFPGHYEQLGVTVTIDPRYDRGLLCGSLVEDTVAQYDPTPVAVLSKASFTALLAVGIGERIVAVRSTSISLYAPDIGAGAIERSTIQIPRAVAFTAVLPVLPLVFDELQSGAIPPSNSHVSIYPLPCQRGAIAHINICGGQSVHNSWEVCDALGRRVASPRISSIGELTVNTQELQPGVYALRTRRGEGNALFTVTP
jgi:hypothetical protein